MIIQRACRLLVTIEFIDNFWREPDAATPRSITRTMRTAELMPESSSRPCFVGELTGDNQFAEKRAIDVLLETLQAASVQKC
jgi:hypothetical protein